MMQLGFVSAILPEYDLEEVFAVASQCGYECVEVMCWPPGKAERRYAGTTHIDVRDLTDKRIEEIQSLCQRYDVAISSLGYYPNPLSPDESESKVAVEHLIRLIEASSQLGIGRVTTFVGRDPKKTIDDNWPRFENVWGPIIEAAEKFDVRIGIENCPMFFGDDEWPGGKNLAISPAVWRRMFDTFPSEHFGLNYDPSHPVFMHMDYLTPMRAFADRLVHVHAKDVRVDQVMLDQVGVFANPNEWHTPKLPGLGQVDWGQFFSILTDTGYSGPVCVEVEDRSYEGSIENRIRALKQSHDYLRNYLPRMQLVAPDGAVVRMRWVDCKVQIDQCKLQGISGLARHLFHRPAIANLQCPFCNLQSPRPTLRSRHIAPEEAVVGDAALLRRVRDRLKVNSVR